jgi:hypothetical protein
MTTKIEEEKRSALLDKITALLAKTERNGCTEAEALAAGDLAQKLMDKYGLSLSELQMIQSPADVCEVDAVSIGRCRAHEILHLASTIATFTDTKAWCNRRGRISIGNGKSRMHTDGEHKNIVLCYFGLKADVQIANYLTCTLRNALDTEWRAYWQKASKHSEKSGRTVRINFMLGMMDRLSERLLLMKEERAATANHCRAIVLAKTHIVAAAYDAFIKGSPMRRGRARYYNHHSESIHAGYAAGNRVSITSGAIE